MKRLWDGLTIAAVLASCGLTILIVQRRLFPALPHIEDSGTKVAGVDSLASSGRRLGPATATITLVEFADFECPSCASLDTVLSTLRAHYAGRLSIAFHYYPLTTIHKNALASAIAAECAADQGRFEEMHHLLFSVQDSLGAIPWSALANRAKVADLATFETCLASDRPKATVERDGAMARALQLAGTPSLLLDGRAVTGAPTGETLQAWIDRVIKHSRS